MTDKIRIAFVKFGGLSAGGTERWLQMMAASMDPKRFAVDYYYCDAAPYVGSDYKHTDTDASRLRYMREHGVNLVKFQVGAKDITVPTHDWLNTDFWDVFRPENYDFVQAAKAGPAEYPFIHMQLPVVEFVSLLAGVDPSPNIAWSVHLSPWQWARWCRMGGSAEYSSVIPIPVLPPATTKNLREELGIPLEAVVAGFHQRADENIFSPIPLAAFAAMEKANRHFVILGGAEKHRAQARELGLHNMHFLPHSGDAERISAFLNTVDIFAHGRSDGETFGAVLAEAMMHGKCCLSHQSGIADAQPETMGPAGLFAASQEEYTEYLDRLFNDTGLRARLSAKAAPHAAKYYSLTACATALEELYETLAGKRTHQSVIKASPAYGFSSLGYLQAGAITDPASIAHHILSGGIPEQYDVALFSYFLPTMACMLDIGANIGLYCLVAAKGAPADARIHAFEPQPDCCAQLRETVFLNNWEDRLFVHNTALGAGAGAGAGILHIIGTGSSLDPLFNANDSLPTITVPLVALDGFVQSQQLERIDFIKIDVEGFEQQVLNGGEETIRRFQPVLFIEIADRVRGRDYRNANYGKTLQWLLDRGYSLYRSTEDGRLEAASPEQEQDHLYMYLCLPTHRAAEITEIKAWCLAAKKKHEAVKAHPLARSRRFAGKLWNFFLLSMRDPRAATAKIRRRSRVGMPKNSAPQFFDAKNSYERHHEELMRLAALPRHRIFVARLEERNYFNHPCHKHADLLQRHPDVREIAVDIGSGIGWCSARLHKEFRRVISIEPSTAGHSIAEACFPSVEYPRITRLTGFAEDVLPTLSLGQPAFFVTNTVLSHLPDETVAAICKAVCAVACKGSIISFSECWGPEHHQELWHIRTQDWWQEHFPGWTLDFHGPQIEGVHGRHKGIHGVYVC